MLDSILRPQYPGLDMTSISCHEQTIELNLMAVAPAAPCPRCGQMSAQVHSHYQRILLELPAFGYRFVLRLALRRLFCRARDCRQRTFAERLTEVAAPHARKTLRVLSFLTRLGLVLGGEPGVRFASRYGLPTSPDTLLRYVRRAPIALPDKLSVAGIDEWAWRKG